MDDRRSSRKALRRRRLALSGAVRDRRAGRRRRERDRAVFAGSGPLLWVVVRGVDRREVDWRARARARSCASACSRSSTSLWWIAGLWAQGGYGINILRYTETVKTVADRRSRTRGAARPRLLVLLRRRPLGPWIEASVEYTQNVLLILRRASDPRRSRCSRRRSCAGGTASSSRCLMLVGVVIAVGVAPVRRPVAARRRVQGVRRQLDRRPRAAQHGAGRAARRARARRCCSALGVTALATVRCDRAPAARVRARRRGARRRPGRRQPPGALERHVLRQEPPAARGRPATTGPTAIARRRRARRTTRACSSCRAPTSRRTGGATPSTRSRPG